MVQINDFLIEKSIKVIGTTAFSIFCYIKSKSKGKFKMFRLRNFTETLNVSKPVVIEYLKKLKKSQFIDIKIVIENGKKSLYVKNNKIGKETLPSYNNIYIKLYINNKDTNNLYKYSKYKDIYYNIIKRALDYQRYNNKYYRSRKFKFGKREIMHVKTLLKNVDSIEDYLDWWLKNKSNKISGLNIGIIACIPIIEEYKIKNKRNISKSKDSSKSKERLLKMKKEMLIELFRNIEDAKKNKREYKFSDSDKEFIDKSIDEGLIISQNKDMRLNF